jgi:hypothetical protein
MATWGSDQIIVYLEVSLVADPTVRVLVKTTERGSPAKRKSIKRDIDFQTFARWAPFNGQPYKVRLLNEDFSPYN